MLKVLDVKSLFSSSGLSHECDWSIS